MRKVLGVVCVAGLLLPAAPPVRADDKADAEAILEKGIKALGGEARLTRFKAATWKGDGTLRLGNQDVKYSGDWAVQAPHQYRAAVTGKAGEMEFKRVRVLDGDKGWVKIDENDAQEMSAQALAETQRELYIQLMTTLLPLRDKAFTLAPLGAAKVGDTPAEGLKVTTQEGREFRLHFNKDSGLLLAVESQVKNAQGDDVKQEVVYSDYKDVEGLKRPMKLTVKRDGKTFIDQTTTEYKPLEKLDDKEFAKP
jgi:hypothetical protein